MEKTAIVIFSFVVISASIASGYQYVGDLLEKISNGLDVLNSYFILIALFSVYKNKSLFTANQLKLFAYATITIMLFSYLYPVAKYWEQNSNDFLSTFVYDLIINSFIFTILIKESQRECGKTNS
ncbi:hypothetical protein BCT63_00045 [Vibrio kanaloae]|uniref:hypothetical protein n=1 Tax=Vibrio kanaloae TaxID=170673 RepID=UPI000C837C0C|nr:hypothetical protein [Vibrio kanaloae]PMM09951.1 hypothetical protein BCT63_00045 [Vibrio kanaloae]